MTAVQLRGFLCGVEQSYAHMISYQMRSASCAAQWRGALYDEIDEAKLVNLTGLNNRCLVRMICFDQV